MAVPADEVEPEDLAEQALYEAMDEYDEELEALRALRGSAPAEHLNALERHYERRVADYAHDALAEYAVNIERDERAAGSLAVRAAGEASAMMHDLMDMDPSLMSVEPLAWGIRRGVRALED